MTSSREEESLYDLLQVIPGADTSVITHAYRARMKDLHPDLNPHSDRDLVARINDAYEVLSDPVRRRDYDEALARRRRESAREQDRKSRSTSQSPPGPSPSSSPPRPPGKPRMPPPPPPSPGFGSPQPSGPEANWTYVPGPVAAGHVVPTNGIAVAAVVVALLGLCLGPLASLPAILMGVAGLRRAGKGAPHRGLATTAIVLGGVGLALSLVAVAGGAVPQLTGLLLDAGRGNSTSASSGAASNAPASEGADLAPGSCRLGGSQDAYTPDPSCTPGAMRSDANSYPMCDPDFVPAPPDEGTLAERKQAVADAYSSEGLRFSPGDVGLLIPARLGGSWSQGNLWPVKSQLNQAQVDRLLDLMCSSPPKVIVEEVLQAARNGSLRKLAAAR